MDITTSQGYARLHCQRIWPHGQITDYNSETLHTTRLRKPDKPIINPPQWDGFRRPSDYTCETIAGTIGRLRPNYLPVVVDVGGGGLSNGSDFRISGKTAVEVPLGAIPNHSDEVRMKVLNNVRNEVLDVAMVLAELSGTAETLGNNLIRLGRSLDQVKLKKPDSFYYLVNGRRKDGRRPTDKFLRESSGAFLEWKYGIMPTIYDIEGATKALDMNEDNSFWDNPALLVNRAVVRGSIPVKQRVDTSIPGNPGGVNSGSNRQHIIVEGTIDYEHKARVDYTVTGEGLRGLNRYGIGLSSIATVAFDKTPFSFVFNMAVPIAELLKAWTALAGCEVRGYCETQYRKFNLHASTNVVEKDGITIVNNVDEMEYPPSFIRKAYASVPMPLPFVRNPVKLGNIQTVLALFTQLRKPE